MWTSITPQAWLQGLIAKEFTARIDKPVAVAIKHHDAVISTDPTRGIPGSVAVVVEENGAGWINAGGFYAVAVEI
ncbi:hypothetical protein Acidovoranil_26980 [Acidovorax sp. FG27]